MLKLAPTGWDTALTEMDEIFAQRKAQSLQFEAENRIWKSFIERYDDRFRELDALGTSNWVREGGYNIASRTFPAFENEFQEYVSRLLTHTETTGRPFSAYLIPGPLGDFYAMEPPRFFSRKRRLVLREGIPVWHVRGEISAPWDNFQYIVYYDANGTIFAANFRNAHNATRESVVRVLANQLPL